MTHTLPDVRQLIPADGWYARFVLSGEDTLDRPLVAWAVLTEPIIRAGRYRSVVGLAAYGHVEACESDCEFEGYYHRDDLAEEEAHRASSGEQVCA